MERVVSFTKEIENWKSGKSVGKSENMQISKKMLKSWGLMKNDRK